MSGKQLKSPNSERLEVINPVRPHEGSIIVPTSQMKNQRLWELQRLNQRLTASTGRGGSCIALKPGFCPICQAADGAGDWTKPGRTKRLLHFYPLGKQMCPRVTDGSAWMEPEIIKVKFWYPPLLLTWVQRDKPGRPHPGENAPHLAGWGTRGSCTRLTSPSVKSFHCWDERWDTHTQTFPSSPSNTLVGTKQ